MYREENWVRLAHKVNWGSHGRLIEMCRPKEKVHAHITQDVLVSTGFLRSPRSSVRRAARTLALLVESTLLHRTFDLPERFGLESDDGEEGLDTPSPRELLDFVPFFFRKFLMVASNLNAILQ